MIAVIIPTLNEEAYIGDLVSQILRDAPAAMAQLLVVDGGSTDRTCHLVERAAAADSRVRLLSNPLKLQSAGFNLAARTVEAEVDILVRVDAHAGYPPGYVADLAQMLHSTGAQSVVVRLKSVGTTCLQTAIAAVSNSRWGTGGAAHRSGGAAGWIDHGHHAAFDKRSFLALGGYDEDFAANEDGEFDLRLAQAGGRIWFSPDIEVLYYPRRTLPALARQYFRYGRGRAKTVRKTRSRPRPRQLAAPLLAVAIAASALAAPFFGWALSIPALYVLAAGLVGLGLALKARQPCVALGGAALIVMHLAWGVGFIVGAALYGRRGGPTDTGGGDRKGAS